MKNNITPSILLLLSLIFVVAFVYIYLFRATFKSSISPQTVLPTVLPSISSTVFTPVPTVNPLKESTNEKTNIKDQYKYTSYKLGISFLYLANGETKTAVKEDGNKIYVYYNNASNANYKTGQYIEIFDKNSTYSLKQAVEEKFLQNYSSTECVYTSENSTNTQNADYPKTYEKGNIKVPGDFTNLEEGLKAWEKCPKPYTVSNGISYFLYDVEHPSKFAFLSIGQYAIMADTSSSWQDTLRFID